MAGYYYVPKGQGALETVETLNRFVEHNPLGCWKASYRAGGLITDCNDCPFNDCKYTRESERHYKMLFEEMICG